MSFLRQRWQTLRDLLLVTLLSLPLTSPLWRLDSVPCTHDGYFHKFHALALKSSWEQGLYFSRWLPDVAFGYGHPFFVFREPLPIYLLTSLHQLGLPLPTANNIFYICCLLAAACFMFLWVRDIFGRTSGFVGAIAYITAPYHLIDSLTRGNMPESISLALFPLILWSSHRFINTGTRNYFLIGVGSIAALGLSHNISTFIFFPLLFTYLFFISYNAPQRNQAFVRTVILLGLGFGSILFYAGTAISEINSVSLFNAVNSRNNSYVFNYTSFQELFSPPFQSNPSLLNPHLYFRLGWMPLGLSILGLLSLRRNKTSKHRRHIWFMLFVAVAYCFMSLPMSKPLWDNIPLLNFVQFPWRFVGRASLPIAFLASAPFASFPTATATVKKSGSSILASIALLLLLLEVMPMLFPTYCEEALFPTIETLFEFEHDTQLIGIDPEATYFPLTVLQIPKESPLENQYQNGMSPFRFNQSLMPDEAIFLSSNFQPVQATATIKTPTAFTAQYLTFDFAGWTAFVDGKTVPITPSDPHGLIQFEVPAGTHEIEVKWGSTLMRTVLSALSIMALAGIVMVTAVSPKSQHPIARPRSTTPHLGKLLLLVAVGFAALKFGIVDQRETIFRRASTPNMAVGGQGLETADFTFSGYTLYKEAVPSGDSFDIDLAWLVKQNPATQYQSNLFVVDENGLIWSEKETHRTRLYESPSKMVFWQPNQWALDSHEVTLETGTPAGEYRLMLNQFVLETLQPLTFSDASGLIGPDAIIGTLTVLPADESREITPQYDKNETLPTGQQLIGYNQDRAEARPGDPLLLSLFVDKGDEKTAVNTLSLLTSSGTHAHSWDVETQSADYVIRNQLPLRLPANLNDDVYSLMIDDILLGTLTIDAPNRIFTHPDIGNPLAYSVGNLATLVSASGDDNAINLIWQVEEETAVSYRVFVHLLDDAGNLVAQSDGEPAQWSRPTTGWVAGEYIEDSHPIAVPDGVTQLSIGLYNSDTGERLTDPIQLAYPLP